MAAETELVWLQVPRAQFFETGRSGDGEFVEQLRERFALTPAEVSPAVEWREGLSFTGLQDGLCAGYPVGAIGVDEMAEDF